MIFYAKDYASREDIQKMVIASVGTDIEANRQSGHTIEGKREELRRLSLDDLTSIYGVRGVISDDPTNKKVKTK